MIIKSNNTILLKGTKIIHVKASKRSKAHIRKIKVSDKPKVVKFDKNNLHLFEDDIKNQDFESCAAFDETGKMVFNKDGEKSRVGFNDAEEVLCEGTVFTHNHPIGHSFSDSDIKWACQSEMREMRVITKHGEKYHMRLKSGRNFNWDMWLNLIGLAYQEANFRVREDFMNAMYNNEMTIQQCNDAHWHSVWSLVAENCSELEYKRVIIHE